MVTSYQLILNCVNSLLSIYRYIVKEWSCHGNHNATPIPRPIWHRAPWRLRRPFVRLVAGRSPAPPAGVVPLRHWLPDKTLQSIAFENSLAETAFFVPEGEGYRLRWFTPAVEVDLCGHATLASAYVITHFLQPERKEMWFETQSGRL